MEYCHKHLQEHISIYELIQGATTTQKNKIPLFIYYTMTRKAFDFRVTGEKLVPFIASLLGISELDVKLAMQLRKDLLLSKDMIRMNDPSQIQKESLVLGSPKRVKIAIRTLKNMGLLVEKTDPETGKIVTVRNLHSDDAIRLIDSMSKKMTEGFKRYIRDPGSWPDFPLLTTTYKIKKIHANEIRNKRRKTSSQTQINNP